MTIRTVLLGTAAALALTQTAAAGPVAGWYVGLEAGANWIEDADAGVDTIDPHWTGGWLGGSTFDSGWATFATFGYAWTDLRAELELGYRANDIDRFFSGKGSVFADPGELNEFSQMLNVIWDIDMGRWGLSLGAGAGGDYNMYKNDAFHTVDIHDNEWVFAWQLMGGVNYQISPRADLFLDYRYFNAESPEFTEFDGGEGFLHNDSYDTLHKNTVTVGIRYALWGEEPAPVEVAPPPPPPPPPPPEAPKQFIVFFGFNKCNITGEADSVLTAAADAAKQTGAAAIAIVGHTDTSGSTTYNQKLSVCRGNAAKTNLAGKGVPAAAISVTGKGETELMVQTGDGVKEPQNRRATVDLH